MLAKQQLITIDDISAENAPAIYVSSGLDHFLEAVTSTTAEKLDRRRLRYCRQDARTCHDTF